MLRCCIVLADAVLVLLITSAELPPSNLTRDGNVDSVSIADQNPL